MKILILNNLYKPYARGGAEKYVDKISNAFSRIGHEVVIISTKPVFAKKLVEEKIYYLNSLYSYLDKFPRIFRLLWHIFNLFNVIKYFKIKNIVMNEKPGLIISNNLMGLGFISPMALDQKGIKHLHVLHDAQLLHPGGIIYLGEEKILDTICSKVYQRINSFFFLNTSYVVSPSKWLLDLHKERGFFNNAKGKRLFNPVDINYPLGKTKIKETTNFLYVGQLENHKGVEVLLESIHKIIHNHKNIVFSVLGSGTKEKYLKNKYSNKNIFFLGRQDESGVFQRMFESDCLIMPSKCYENSPTVIYEAAVCNLDFIYPNFGGTAEIGRYFGGIGFDPQKKNSLEETIETYLNNKRDVHKRRELALELSSEKYISQLMDFLGITQKHF